MTSLREYVPPTFRADSFNCPHCGAFGHQEWSNLIGSIRKSHTPTEAAVSRCQRCQFLAYWVNERLVVPSKASAPPPHPDMPGDVQEDYLEARDVGDRSPRAACALLRLGLQKLMVDLGESGTNINSDIASLVGKGLPVRVQQSLDTLRVVGNNAVHPGEMDLRDDVDTARALFGVMNFIVEQQIEQPRKLDELYGKLPASAQDAIAKRDGI